MIKTTTPAMILFMVIAVEIRGTMSANAELMSIRLEDTSRRSGRDPARHLGVPPEREHLASRPRSDRHQPRGVLPVSALPAGSGHPGCAADVRGAPARADRLAGKPARSSAALLDLPQRRPRHPGRHHRALPARNPARPRPVRPHRVHRPATLAL